MMTPKKLSPDLVIRFIIYVNIALFIASLVLSGRGVEISLNPFTAFSPTTNALIFLGATGTIPIDGYQEWWSLVSANWLHGSLLHILFNMIALVQIGPLIIHSFGISRMFVVYSLGGTAGFYLSYLAGVSLTIGASAAICSLIGAALYFGKSRGGDFGRIVYRQTSGWIISLAIFGFLVPGINNWGHGGGVAAGIFLGWILGYNERKVENIIHQVLAGVCAILTLGILTWSLVWGVFLSL